MTKCFGKALNKWSLDKGRVLRHRAPLVIPLERTSFILPLGGRASYSELAAETPPMRQSRPPRIFIHRIHKCQCAKRADEWAIRLFDAKKTLQRWSLNAREQS